MNNSVLYMSVMGISGSVPPSHGGSIAVESSKAVEFLRSNELLSNDGYCFLYHGPHMNTSLNFRWMSGVLYNSLKDNFISSMVVSGFNLFDKEQLCFEASEPRFILLSFNHDTHQQFRDVLFKAAKRQILFNDPQSHVYTILDSVRITGDGSIAHCFSFHSPHRTSLIRSYLDIAQARVIAFSGDEWNLEEFVNEIGLLENDITSPLFKWLKVVETMKCPVVTMKSSTLSFLRGLSMRRTYRSCCSEDERKETAQSGLSFSTRSFGRDGDDNRLVYDYPLSSDEIEKGLENKSIFSIPGPHLADNHIRLLHGTNQSSAQNILDNGINLDLCKSEWDFGSAFYTTPDTGGGGGGGDASYISLVKAVEKVVTSDDGQWDPPTLLMFDIPSYMMLDTTRYTILDTRDDTNRWKGVIEWCRNQIGYQTDAVVKKFKNSSLVIGPISCRGNETKTIQYAFKNTSSRVYRDGSLQESYLQLIEDSTNISTSTLTNRGDVDRFIDSVLLPLANNMQYQF